jgi:hypothetical protein
MKWLRWTGVALSLFGIIFVAGKIIDYADQLGALRPSVTQILLFVALATASGIANLALAAAWKNLLAHAGTNIQPCRAIRIYGMSQLAKYVPGNVFHLAGRQAIGMSDGVGAGVLAKSAIWELGSVAFAAGLFAIWLTPVLVAAISNLDAAIAFLAALIAVSYIAYRQFSKFVTQAIVWYVGFFLVSGIIFIALLVLSHTGNLDVTAIGPGICGAYVIAWLAGLVTPGAPAGVGIREIVLFTLLQSLVNDSDLLVAIVLGRLVTAGGDLFFYLFALVLPAER